MRPVPDKGIFIVLLIIFLVLLLLLVQVGLLDEKLYPTAGIATARKAFDENEPSNTLMARWKESEGK